MTSNLITRSFSFAIAAAMTLAMLGGIDHLSQPQSVAATGAQMAQTVSAAQS
ncbi:MAG: hypothetical protein ABIN96_01370 [Rubrivivax sp.]